MSYKNVCECFMLAARRMPNKTAIVFDEQRISYAQLNSRVNRIANALAERGIKSGDKVAYLFSNCPELVMVYYALQKIGAVAVPLNFRLIAREIRLLVEISESKMLIFAAQFADKVAEADLPQGVSAVCAIGRDARFPLTLEDMELSAPDSEPVLPPVN